MWVADEREVGDEVEEAMEAEAACAGLTGERSRMAGGLLGWVGDGVNNWRVLRGGD